MYTTTKTLILLCIYDNEKHINLVIFGKNTSINFF
jgi:hypothetical protein